jgi:5-formyltetrahydrofolate cyclo-ligase
MTKAEIRKSFLEKRTNIGFWQRNELSQNITDQFLYKFHSKIIAGCNIHMYLPIEKKAEVNTNFLLKVIQNRFRKSNVIVPATDFKIDEMSHFLINENTNFEENKYGIPEPIDGEKIDTLVIDIIIVPLLAFSESGHRIGYGGGYYDKFLAKTKTDCLKVGFSFFDPIDTFETENTDIQLDFCITPQKIWSFSAKN